MSKTDTPTEADEPKQPTLSYEEGRKQTKRYDNLTKEYHAELPEGGIWVFEFQMLDNEEQLIEENTTVSKGREGVQEDTDIESLRYDAFVNGVVEAPEGFPLSKTKIKRADKLTRKIVKQVGDEVLDFTNADSETIHQFR